MYTGLLNFWRYIPQDHRHNTLFTNIEYRYFLKKLHLNEYLSTSHWFMSITLPSFSWWILYSQFSNDEIYLQDTLLDFQQSKICGYKVIGMTSDMIQLFFQVRVLDKNFYSMMRYSYKIHSWIFKRLVYAS